MGCVFVFLCQQILGVVDSFRILRHMVCLDKIVDKGVHIKTRLGLAGDIGPHIAGVLSAVEQRRLFRLQHGSHLSKHIPEQAVLRLPIHFPCQGIVPIRVKPLQTLNIHIF